jgi:RNA 3'-terminal phosphate cyclase (ATP)
LKSLKQLIPGAKVEGDFIKSKQVTFQPGPNLINRKEYVADCQTPGSVFLISQMMLPCLAFQQEQMIKLTIKGGTNVSKSPVCNSYLHTFLPALSLMGIKVDYDVKKHGLFPDVVGEIELSIHSMNGKGPLKAIEMT